MNTTTNQVHLALIGILQNVCGERGDNEGAVETLQRVIAERDALQTAFHDELDTNGVLFTALCDAVDANLLSEKQNIITATALLMVSKMVGCDFDTVGPDFAPLYRAVATVLLDRADYKGLLEAL